MLVGTRIHSGQQPYFILRDIVFNVVRALVKKSSLKAVFAKYTVITIIVCAECYRYFAKILFIVCTSFSTPRLDMVFKQM
uniref:Uncharacterized protein n=1 Tax=Trichogramma kaykai TaxID=54128 RepID=A0ABD2VVD7_9HYME